MNEPNDPLFLKLVAQELMDATGRLLDNRATLERQWVNTLPPVDPAAVYWYRVTDQHESDSYFDDWGDYHPSNRRNVRIVITSHKVLATTPKGVWLSRGWISDDRRWASATSRKRFAFPTLEEAWTSFRARKRKQERIYEERFAAARKARKLADLSLEEALSTLGFDSSDPHAVTAAERQGCQRVTRSSAAQHYSARIDPMGRFLDP